MKKRINNIFFAIGLIAVVVMLITFDVSFTEFWHCVSKAGGWIAAILLLWTGLYMMNACAWRVIISGSGDCTISFMRLFRFTISGFALNYATPMGMVGGEAYRIMALSKYIGVRRATSSVILFAMMHIFSHFWFWITAVAAYIILAVFGYLPLGIPMAIVLAFTVLFSCGGIYLFVKGYKNGMVVKLIRLVSRIPGLRNWGTRFAEAHRDDLAKIDSQIAELQGQNKRSFMGSFMLEYVGRLFQCLEIYFMLLIFGINGGGSLGGHLLTFVHSFLILAFTSLFANLLGFMPLQLGGREGGFAMSVNQMGMTSEIAMFISIICRARELFWTFLGLMLMKFEKN